MKDLKDYITEGIKPPRLSAKNKHLWKNGILDKERVMKWLNDNCWFIGKVEIVNGKINVDGNINLKAHTKNILYPFGEVTGDFNCYGCKLTTLKDTPERVGGSFYCHFCDNLTSLEGAPKEVGGEFWCSFCDNLTSLEGAPKEVGKNFYCCGCGKEFTGEDVEKVCNVKGKFFV